MLTRRALLQSALILPIASPWLVRIASAQDGTKPDEIWLQTIAQQLRDEFKLPAVWLSAAIDDTVQSVAVGVHKVGDQTLAKADDLLTIGSIAKPMVGLWIATLVEAGKLTYQAKALDVLPELADVCLPEHRDINLGQLLSHTAGLARDIPGYPSNLTLEQYPAERIRQVKILLAIPSPPDSRGKELYSNDGLTLAAAMAERVAGEPYEIAAGRFYHERLGLKSWGVWDVTAPNDLSVPWPHTMENGVAVASEPRSLFHFYTRPSGNVRCTIADCARFGLMATHAMESANTILKPSSWDRILARVPNSQNTLGSMTFSIASQNTSYGHGGSLTTTRSNLLVIPGWRVSIAIHTNAGSDAFYERAADVVLDAVRKSYAKTDPPPPCRITLLDINTMDASWKNVVVPKTTDDRLRVRVKLLVETQSKTGDLKTTLKVGTIERADDRFYGLSAGENVLYFGFDMPKEKTVSAILTIDALQTAGNVTPDAARFESSLTLQ